MKPKIKHSSTEGFKRSLKIGMALGVALSLSACSTMSLSDFGLGGDDKKQTVTAPQQTTAPQRTTVSSAKKEEPGMWDRVTGWFGSDDTPAQKADKLASANAPQSQAAQTSQAANASLRAAQDVTKMRAQQPTPQQIASPQVTAPQISAPTTPTAPIQIARTSPVPAVPQKITSQAPQALSATPPQVQANTAQQVSGVQQQAQQQAQKIVTPTRPKEEESFLDRIGNFFSSDSSKKVAQAQPQKKPQSSVNSFARQATNTASNDTEDDTVELTPVQTLRLARQSTRGTQATSQGLTPYVPNTSNPPQQVADANLRTNSVQSPKPSKTVVTQAPKVATPKVAVKPIAPQTPTRVAPVRTAASTQSAKTSYVVTPETYRAARTNPNIQAQQAKAPTGNLANAAPNQEAFKFFFNPGSAELAPHHIAQLRGLAGQAIARQRKVTILGTSNPGGEAGKGASPLDLQNIATARAMAAARNLQKFGVPSNMINMRIAQSTTPSEIGTGGNKTLRTMTARRVEVSIQ